MLGKWIPFHFQQNFEFGGNLPPLFFHPPQSWPTSEGLKNWKLRETVESAPISAANFTLP